MLLSKVVGAGGGQHAEEVITARTGALQQYEPGSLQVGDCRDTLQKGVMVETGFDETSLFVLPASERCSQDLESLRLRGQGQISNPTGAILRAELAASRRFNPCRVPDARFTKIYLDFGVLPKGGGDGVEDVANSFRRTDDIYGKLQRIAKLAVGMK